VTLKSNNMRMGVSSGLFVIQILDISAILFVATWIIKFEVFGNGEPKANRTEVHVTRGGSLA